MAILLVVAVIGAAVGFLVLRDDDGGVVAAGELFLEPIDAVGPDPFTSPVADAPDETLRDFSTSDIGAPTSTTGATTTTTATVTTTGGVTDRPRTVSGSEPGLYGGTQEEGSCDPDQLVEFLESNADKAAAFAQTLGIEVAAIATYVGDLTPVFLTADTRVTNHGFSNGRPTPRQAVLQRGTAVMVDTFGIPRVKCYCGNPLLPPELISEGARTGGQRWTGFNPSAVTSIRKSAEVIEIFVLVSIETGERFERPAGSVDDEDVGMEPELGTGDVQVTLRWGTTDDIDLAVTDPGGATISFTSPSSSSGGQLDVDAHGGCEDTGAAGVENIFWPSGLAPPGEYVVTVTHFLECPGGGGSVSFTVTVNVDGDVRETVSGTLSPNASQEVYRFTR